MPATGDRADMKTITSRNYRKGRISQVRVVVIHDMEAPEGPNTAENVAAYFRNSGVVASAHVCVDNDSAVRCVPDSDTAYAAPGANADGLQLEIAGYMRQTREQWLDDYSRAALKQAAKVTADWCKKYKIPAVRLTRAELKAGKRGITSHADVSAVYKKSDHTDPGPGFPWDFFLAEVKTAMGASQPPVTSDTGAVAPPWPGRYLMYRDPLMSGTDIATWQRQMRARGWTIAVDGLYGSKSREVATAFQRDKGLDDDGIVGPATWESTWTTPIT